MGASWRREALMLSREGERFKTTSLGKTGAGEGIRTLDPNLGKVVLYP
jgi:hypothetical protein